MTEAEKRARDKYNSKHRAVWSTTLMADEATALNELLAKRGMTKADFVRFAKKTLEEKINEKK